MRQKLIELGYTPELRYQWNPERNEFDLSEDLETGFLRKIWWGCEKYQRNPVSGLGHVRIYGLSPKKPGFY